MAYFWTNTPDQVQFITAAAEVNKLHAYITDPNTSEAEAKIYAEQLIAAGEQMEAIFDAIVEDWYAWLNANQIVVPKMGKSGVIRTSTFPPDDKDVIMQLNGQATTGAGETYFWEDFYRMIALQCFFGRVAPPADGEKYNPESQFHE